MLRSVLVMMGCAVAMGVNAQTVVDGSGSKLTEKRLRQVIEGVSNRLTDPLSAQFRRFKAWDNEVMVCGEVNAKNRMGGYNGFQRFTVHSDDMIEIEPPKGGRHLEWFEIWFETACKDAR